jgi:hypothetical protein
LFFHRVICFRESPLFYPVFYFNISLFPTSCNTLIC